MLRKKTPRWPEFLYKNNFPSLGSLLRSEDVCVLGQVFFIEKNKKNRTYNTGSNTFDAWSENAPH